MELGQTRRMNPPIQAPESLPSAPPDTLGLCPQRTGHLLAVVQDEIERRRVPGAVVLVARHGRLAVFEALGVQDPATGVAMARDSIFRLYSMTKPIISVAVMMLLEQGRFLLADPVAKYLPEFADQQVAVERDGVVSLQPVARAATIHDLLRHTAGLTYEFSGDSAVQRLYRERGLHQRVTGQDNLRAAQVLAQVPLMFQPGSVGDYSRATDVLGRLIEVWSGHSLGAFLQRHILGPLGMHDTAFHVPPSHHGRIAQPFERDPDGGVLPAMFDVREPPTMESGGGGLVGTAHDYARFLQMLLNKGRLGDLRLLGPHTVDYMTTDHLGRIPANASLLEPGEGFGLGFAVRTAPGVVPVPGSVGTYYWSGMGGTSFFVDPAADMFAVMLVQGINQRAYYRQQFRSLVYASLVD
jgi:CubicO group peptidase (beta-lactamase class C family)